MGKEWLYHLGGGGGYTRRSRSSTRGKTSSETERDNSSSSSTLPSGCINPVLQLFRLHHFRFPNLHHPPKSPPHSFVSQEPPIHLKGIEAPRNSLEMEETSFMGTAVLSSSSTIKNEQTSPIPMGGIQIKTSGHTTSSGTGNDFFSSECTCSSSSPAGTKTPTLVARLMGLDLLPETSSPRPSFSSSSNRSSSNPHLHYQKVKNHPKKTKKAPVSSSVKTDVMSGSRSLPETPRISSARRSDVDHRYSLQINKENYSKELAISQEFEFSKFLTKKIAAAGRKEDENMSPGHYAKQIVQQFKENVSCRSVGRDVTNTVEQRRDHGVLLKSKKPSLTMGDNYHDQSAPPNSCSPRPRFLEVKNRTSHSPRLPISPLSKRTKRVAVSSNHKAQGVPLKEQQKRGVSIQKFKKIAGEKDCPRIKKPPQTSGLIRSKQEESFVRPSSSTSRAKSNHLSAKKCKKNTSPNVATILSVKNDPSPPSTTRLHQQQEGQNEYQMSNVLRDSYKQEAAHMLTTFQYDMNCNSNGAEVTEYISRIIKCMGIDDFTPVSFTKWSSPSHPLDPSIFHHLEASFPKWDGGGYNNRKLLFELVDELLVEILRPDSHARILYGSQLIDTLYDRIGSFRSADCRVLEDIDVLVSKDLFGWQLIEKSRFEEEGDGIVTEIEGDILDRLVHETLVVMLL